MKRNTVIIFLLVWWVVSGCAVGAQKKSTAKMAQPDVISQPQPETVDAGAVVKTEESSHQPDQVESPPESLSRRTAERKPLVKKAPAELTIYFEANSNELSPDQTAKLDKIAETLRQHPQAGLTLNGYTDAGGSADYNVMVAQGRASSVKFYLVAKGVDPSKISVVPKGAKEFVAENETEEGRSQNRRVEIKLKMNQ